MPGTTTHFGIKFAQSADEVEKYPAEVSEPGMKKIDEVLYEGNKVANSEPYETSVSRTTGVEYEASAARATFVMLEIQIEAGKEGIVELSVKLGALPVSFSGGKSTAVAAENAILTPSFIVPATAKWKYEGTHIESCHSYYLKL